jgi:hypothetical protein
MKVVLDPFHSIEESTRKVHPNIKYDFEYEFMLRINPRIGPAYGCSVRYDDRYPGTYEGARIQAYTSFTKWMNDYIRTSAPSR